MSEIKNMLIAKNEIENMIENVKQAFSLNEIEMSVVLEMVLSTSRYKAFVRNIYEEAKKGEADNGNSNEKGQ